jgi:hypothetical protein
MHSGMKVRMIERKEKNKNGGGGEAHVIEVKALPFGHFHLFFSLNSFS